MLPLVPARRVARAGRGTGRRRCRVRCRSLPRALPCALRVRCSETRTRRRRRRCCSVDDRDSASAQQMCRAETWRRVHVHTHTLARDAWQSGAR